MKAINKSKLNDLLKVLAKEGKLIVPQEVEGVTKFAEYTDGIQLMLDKNTLLSPKDTVFPQTETMYNFTVNNLKNSIEEVAATGEKQIVFGVRPCDMKSIRLLDLVFLTKGFEDKFYKSKRENTVFISLGCEKAEPSCFCDKMQVNPQVEEGADLALINCGDEYGVEAKTDKGEELLKQLKGLLTDAKGEPKKVEGFSLDVVSVDGVKERLQKMFEHPIWDDVYRKCIGCGTCTYLCPTCHCFDVQGKKVGKSGENYRCWDSCMFSDYALMAGGHDPRPTGKERVRQRFMHKLRYFPERYDDELMCVGCGRCLKKCPVNVDITKLIGQIKEADINVG
ncbi:ferredoxin [Desulfitispora alkaliphila]|uniref:4Fe-4S dicluster domain-containing protein n=1 Tax=Desulfitispora alkaliphila TaxID=622674 RepID=UPI003D1A8C71